MGDVLEALSEDEVDGLASTLHALYRMGDHRWVMPLLRALWNEDLAAYPSLDWGRLSAPAARAALASTLARLDPTRREVYLGYLREVIADPDPFARVQAATGLGFAADPADVPRLVALARSVSVDGEAAVAALGTHGTVAARAALLTLRDTEGLDPQRRALARQVLAEAYPDPRGAAAP